MLRAVSLLLALSGTAHADLPKETVMRLEPGSMIFSEKHTLVVKKPVYVLTEDTLLDLVAAQFEADERCRVVTDKLPPPTPKRDNSKWWVLGGVGAITVGVIALALATR